MDLIQGTKLSGRKYNRLLDAVVTIPKYKESAIDQGVDYILLDSSHLLWYFI